MLLKGAKEKRLGKMDKNKIKFAMIAAVSKALGYKEQLSSFDPDWPELYQKMLPEIEQTKDKGMRMAMIAAISKAIKYLQTHAEAKETEVIQYILDETDSILNTVEKFR